MGIFGWPSFNCRADRSAAMLSASSGRYDAPMQWTSPTSPPPIPDDLRAALQMLAGLPDAVRQSLTDHLHATIPVAVSEHSYNPVLAPATDLFVRAQTGGLELITGILAVIPSGCTGVVQLGTLVIPVSQGTTLMSPVRREMGTSDTRKISYAAGTSGVTTGAVLLWIWGDQQPTYGVMAN